jgi:hypothetical protein
MSKLKEANMQMLLKRITSVITSIRNYKENDRKSMNTFSERSNENGATITPISSDWKK